MAEAILAGYVLEACEKLESRLAELKAAGDPWELGKFIDSDGGECIRVLISYIRDIYEDEGHL